MFVTSKDIYWVVLAGSILLVAIFFSFVLYRIARLIEESQKTVKDVNKKLEKVDPILEEGVPAATSFIETIDGINKHLLKPALGIGSAIKGAASIFSVFRRKKNKNK